jgi:hypothetical protein
LVLQNFRGRRGAHLGQGNGLVFGQGENCTDSGEAFGVTGLMADGVASSAKTVETAVQKSPREIRLSQRLFVVITSGR